MESFQKRFLRAKELRELRWIDIAKKSGLNKAQISQYKNGKHEPEQDALYKLATALDVNVAWLMGNDVPMENPCAEEKKLINRYRKLNEAGKLEFMRILDTLESNEKFTR